VLSSCWLFFLLLSPARIITATTTTFLSVSFNSFSAGRILFYYTLTTSSLYKHLPNTTNPTVKMQFSLATVILGFAALASAAPSIVARQNGNRPVPQGACCVANTSLKQDACTAQNGSQGRCVPGGNDCKTA
jgi:hypothetical protein